jgi:hypothetical protein
MQTALNRLSLVTRSLTTSRNMSKPLLLYTAGTPNGRKVSVFLEELKAIYGSKVDYECVAPSYHTTRPVLLLTNQRRENRYQQKHPKRTLVHQIKPEWTNPRPRRSPAGQLCRF